MKIIIKMSSLLKSRIIDYKLHVCEYSLGGTFVNKTLNEGGRRV
jgi:hypothetical protein